jgi:hypothetical protein
LGLPAISRVERISAGERDVRQMRNVTDLLSFQTFLETGVSSSLQRA